MRLGIVGYSGSGKSTLVEKLIGALTKEGYRIAAVKHTSEEKLDKEGKDTSRFSNAGACVVAGAGANETAFFVEKEMDVDEICMNIDRLGSVDVILIEGFKGANVPKVAVGEGEFKNVAMRYNDNFGDVLSYIKGELAVEKVQKRLPGNNCGKCGRSCGETARLIAAGKANFEDCRSYSDSNDISVIVNDKDLPMNKFVRDMLAGTIVGALGALKGVGDAKKIEVRINRK